jgi:hypothetical protein
MSYSLLDDRLIRRFFAIPDGQEREHQNQHITEASAFPVPVRH